VSSMLAAPVDVAPCFQCEEVFLGWFGRWRWRYLEREGVCNGFASGYAAFAVRPRFFDKRIWDQASGPEGCRLHDDVWISGSMLVAAGVRPMLLRPGFFSAVSHNINQPGGRQKESVFVANSAAQARGLDPQGQCVAHFPFAGHIL